MAEYRDKMRLKEMLRKGDIGPLKRYLVLEGYDDDVVESGLKFFVESWEESVEWFVKVDGLLDPDEHDHDMMPRTELCIVLPHATKEEVKLYAERIQKADEQFKKLTSECDVPTDPVWDIKELDREAHWWLFRWSKK